MLNFTVRTSLYVHTAKLMAIVLPATLTYLLIHSSCISNYDLHNYSLVFDQNSSLTEYLPYVNTPCSIYDKSMLC